MTTLALLDNYLTFADVARRMQSRDAKLQQLPYWNRRGLKGTTLGFFLFCEWFEVNVHDADAMSPEDVLKLLQASPDTRLDNRDTDDHGVDRWLGGAWVEGHHVRVWYNPQSY
jgi:hypothetical protein